MGIFEDDDDENKTRSTKNIFEKDKREQTNGNIPDPSAKRNVGPNGDLERKGQMDRLENLHIGGNEATGYGANDPDSVESISQGPGFEVEGSYEAGEDGAVNGIRSGDQEFGSKEVKPNENVSGYENI
ncbi:hypothetical protein [Adhaeribacter aquaticus]|uniref:hypothetical protein n=1 Tax=Adhaeribacter aquaticus TaxID=299567 RepID=UPI00042718D7|nr:hypothetical protein [Adhaeribacter aquaticus]